MYKDKTMNQENKDCMLHRDKIHQLELNMTELKTDIKHIRNRIDDGLSNTITKVYDTIIHLSPQVDKNTKISNHIITAVFSIVSVSVIGGIITLMWYFATKQ